MERLFLIVCQLEESKRFIKTDDVAYLRIALLLLDNASEVLMYRTVVDALQHNDYYDRIFSNARKCMPKEEYEKFKAETSYKLIPKSQHKAILRYYDQKVDFLIERGNLEEAVGGVLKSMHRYRNEAYHREFVRKATIKPAVILLYELVCHLLETLKPGGMSFSSGDNWSKFYQKYKLDNMMSIMSGGLEKIVASLRDSMVLSCTDLGKLLSEHLHDRIEGMRESLEFIINEATGANDLAGELKRIQYWNKYKRLPIKKEDQDEFDHYSPKYSFESFSEWKKASDALLEEREKLEVFNKFSKIEAALEPLETMISEVAVLVDQAIQAEIDRRRGK
jgi:hypothetical protein